MTLGEYLGLVLTQAPAVAALVGERVYSEVLPDEPKTPAVVFDVISEDEDVTLDGPTGTRRSSIEVVCWGKKRADSTALARAVRGILSGHSGGAGGFEVQGVFFLNTSWDFDDETGLWLTTQDYEVWSSGAEE